MSESCDLKNKIQNEVFHILAITTIILQINQKKRKAEYLFEKLALLLNELTI